VGPVKLAWGSDGTGSGCEKAIIRNNIFLNGERYLVNLQDANGVIMYNNVIAKTDGEPVEDGMLWMGADKSYEGVRSARKRKRTLSRREPSRS